MEHFLAGIFAMCGEHGIIERKRKKSKPLAQTTAEIQINGASLGS
jgi:hypothetical protein